MVVQGPWMQQLGLYVTGAKPNSIMELSSGWSASAAAFEATGRVLHDHATAAEDGFSSTSMSGQAAKKTMVTSGDESNKKAAVVRNAVEALGSIEGSMIRAMRAHEDLKHSLPHSLVPVDESKYPTEVSGTVDKKTADANKTKLADAKSKYAVDEAKVAHAEQVAHEHVRDYDNTVADAEPKIRPLIDSEPGSKSGGGSSGAGASSGSSGMPAGTPTTVAGSHTQIAASQARIDKTPPENLYRDGIRGSDIINAERANIHQAMQENIPTWDPNQGMWVNADGTPAPATAYAMVDTPDGPSPLSTTAAAVGAAFGVAGLGAAGVAMAKSGMFGPRIAAAVGAGAKTTAVKSSLSNAATRTAGYRPGEPGSAGSRTSSAAATKNSGQTGRGTGGRGTGGAGRGRKKNKKGAKSTHKWIANTDADWIDPDDTPPAPGSAGGRNQ